VRQGRRGSQQFLAAPGISDSCLGHEIESSAVNDSPAPELCICSEEDGGPKDPLKGGDQPAVLSTSLLKPEGVQHLSGAAEYDPWRSLPNRYRRQEDREKAVLSLGQPVARKPGHLEDEVPVSALVKKAVRSRSLQGKAARDEGWGGESNILARGFAVGADQLNRLNLRSFCFETATPGSVSRSRGPTRCKPGHQVCVDP
jgi:hypothetical protein